MQCPPSVFAYAAPCEPALGGIKAVYVADPAKVNVSLNASAGNITLTAVTFGNKPFYKLEVAPNGSTLQVDAQINEANNVRYWASDLSVALNGFIPTSAGAALLTRLSRIDILVELKNGGVIFLGLKGGEPLGDTVYVEDNPTIAHGAEVSGFTWTPGQNTGDAVRATLAAHLDSLYMPPIAINWKNLVNS